MHTSSAAAEGAADGVAVAKDAAETLDPARWDELLALGHRMMDDVVAYLRDVRNRPVWRPVPPEVRARLRSPLPVEPEGLTAAYADFMRDVLPFPTGNIHPRFWGWVIGTGTPSAALAELLAGALNSSVSVFDDAPSLVETQVLDWCKEMLGFPAQASGLLVSGASMATLVGLTVARNARAGFDVRQEGLQVPWPRLTLYASVETHACVPKAVEVLGLGRQALHLVPVDGSFRIDVRALEARIAQDRAAGLRPFCIVGNAGTVNTGAVDDLEALAALARREGLWFHVDGAFGALAALSPELRPLLAGMEKADSLGFDLHKWGYLPLEVGCVLVRRADEHRAAFANAASYLTAGLGGLSGRTDRFSDYGIQLGRGFRALKVWMLLKEHGVAKLGRLVHQNVEQARYLAALVERTPGLELLAPVPLNVVCFRFVGDGRAADLDTVNRRILVALHESGVAAPSSTVIGGRFVLRAAVTNHRSRQEDFDLLVREVLRLGERETRSGPE